MSAGKQLRVRVNDELLLDAGICEEIEGEYGRERLIRPPEVTLFRQLLAYLRSKPEPPRRPSGTVSGHEAVAATALVLRWGSYLSVLADREKPVLPEACSPGRSRVSDDEMARINIEAAAALAEWIDFHRAHRGGGDYLQLVERAVCYLPMPLKTVSRVMTEFAVLAHPEMVANLLEANDAVQVDRVRAVASRHPSRVFANALVNTSWRNGPIEDIHAGIGQAYSLDHRRITPKEERMLMAFTAQRMSLGMSVCLRLVNEEPRREWAEQVLPYGLAELLGITPSRWTLTETSREIRLPVD